MPDGELHEYTVEVWMSAKTHTVFATSEDAAMAEAATWFNDNAAELFGGATWSVTDHGAAEMAEGAVTASEGPEGGR